MKYPDEAPVFEVVKIEQECRGRIVVGTGFYCEGLDVITLIADDKYALLDEWDCYHYEWLKPLTPAAREMMDALMEMQ